MNKQLKNTALIIAGCFLAVVGVIGVVLPLVPGMPFLMLAAACFSNLEQ